MKTSVSGAGQVEPRPRQYLGPDLNLISGRGLQTVQQAADNQDNSVCGHRHQQQSVYSVTGNLAASNLDSLSCRPGPSRQKGVKGVKNWVKVDHGGIVEEVPYTPGMITRPPMSL